MKIEGDEGKETRIMKRGVKVQSAGEEERSITGRVDDSTRR